MINLKFSNLSKQGNVGLGMAIAYFTSKAYPVSIPLNDCQKYDLIYDDNGIIKRVQVKTTRGRNKTSYIVQLRTISGRKILGFDHTAFDELFVLTEEGNMYLIPAKYLEVIKSNISLTTKFDIFKISL